jgi:hypothetical protein
MRAQPNQAIRHHRLKGAIYSGLVVQGVEQEKCTRRNFNRSPSRSPPTWRACASGGQSNFYDLFSRDGIAPKIDKIFPLFRINGATAQFGFPPGTPD